MPISKGKLPWTFRVAQATSSHMCKTLPIILKYDKYVIYMLQDVNVKKSYIV